MSEAAFHKPATPKLRIEIRKKDLFFILVFFGILGASLSNLWRLTLYPFPDLPNHLAEAYLYRQLANPVDSLHQYYHMVVTPLTTATIHLYFCSLFSDVELGNRIFYSVYMLLLPICSLLLIRSAGGNRWFGLLSFLFIYNFSLVEGFSAFSMGIALVVLDMLVLAKFLTTPSPLWTLALALVGVLLFYAHAVLLLFSCLAVLVILLSGQGISIRSRLLAIAALVPAFSLLIVWFIQFRTEGSEQPMLSFLASYYRADYFSTLGNRLVGLLYDNKQIAGRPTGHLLALLFAAPLLIGFIASGAREKFRNLLHQDTGARHVSLVFFVLAGLCYLLLPDHLPGWWFLYQRFSVFLFLGLIWILSWLVPPAFIKSAQILTVLLVIGHTLLWFQYFSAFNGIAKPFRTLLYHAPQSSGLTLSAIIDEYDFRGSPILNHFQNYQLIWNHGAVPSAITDYRFKLVERLPGLPPYQEWIHNDSYTNLVNNYAGEELMLVHGTGPQEFIQQDDRYRLLGSQAGWELFRKVR